MILSQRTPRINRVAIYDDDPTNRESLADVLSDAGFDPTPIDHPASDLNDCVTMLMQFDASLMDHRVKAGGYGNFDGAAVVQRLYAQKRPSVLVTAWARGDWEELQPYRRQLVDVISKEDADDIRICEAFDRCLKEYIGNYPPDRRPTKTIVRIAETYDPGNGHHRVRAFVPAWDPQEGVTFPIDIVPNTLREYLKEDIRLLAEVNTGALSQEELFFENFSLAKEPSGELAKLLRS
ncbi:response regulator [Mariprofundus ferrooxydans]|uniref:response regulator n=1 Tax=Mariprofundus ferrooxydans TaxID=314344 RepID=UPI0012DD7E6E|nr:response regulator [Mariprofundus ferrooxydans]